MGEKKGQSVGGSDDLVSRKDGDSIRRQKDNPICRQKKIRSVSSKEMML